MDNHMNVFPVRRLSSRKSKPSMADLVDQHRLPTSSAYLSIAPPSGSLGKRLSDGSPSGDPLRLKYRPKLNFELPDTNHGPDNILGLGSDSESDSDSSIKHDPSSNNTEEDEEEDSLPLADLCKRVVHPSSASLCSATNCSCPASQSDRRMGGRYCSVGCLLRACHQAFHDAFPNSQIVSRNLLDQQAEEGDDRLLTSTPPTFANSATLVSKPL
ncbi:hypothetical protein Aperf_G00000110136 [Anoplocephala perfoliata]